MYLKKNNYFGTTTIAILILGFAFLGLFTTVKAQSEPESEAEEQTDESYYQEPTFAQRLAPGGNFSLQFGDLTFIDVSPVVGYRFTNNFVAGPGFTYRYLRFRGFDATSTYGPRAFARYVIRRQFFIQSEYESLSVQFVTGDPQEPLVREWVPGLFIGGGLFQPIGERAGFMIAAMYNLSHDNLRSPYNSPWVFNAGFTF